MSPQPVLVVPTFRNRVGRILFVRPQEEMFRIDADRVIAVMTDAQPTLNLAAIQSPRQAMCGDILAAKPHVTVMRDRFRSARPQPAIAALVDACFKRPERAREPLPSFAGVGARLSSAIRLLKMHRRTTGHTRDHATCRQRAAPPRTEPASRSPLHVGRERHECLPALQTSASHAGTASGKRSP